MLAEEASATKQGGQELIGGLDVRVARNRYGTQIQSFVANLDLPFLGSKNDDGPFRGVFIRAPVVEEINVKNPGSAVINAAAKMTTTPPTTTATTNGHGPVRSEADGEIPQKGAEQRDPVRVLGVYKKDGAQDGEEDIVAVMQNNVFGTSFHPELTDDTRIHAWWLWDVIKQIRT